MSVADHRSPVAGDDAPATGDQQPATVRWSLLYSFVLAELALIVAILYAFTKHFQ